MAKLDIETSNLRKYGQELIDETKELETLFNDMFDSIGNMAEKAWSGAAAVEYSKIVREERAEYHNLKESIKSDGNILIGIADYVEEVIRRI